MKKHYLPIAIAAIASTAVIVPVFAQTNTPSGAYSRGMMRGNKENGKPGSTTRPMMVRPAAVGTVTAINGATITVSGGTEIRNPQNNTNTQKITYTVDATNAKVIKNNATSTLSSIIVGDMIVVQGTTSGTNIVATVIRDGMMRQGGARSGENDNNATGTEKRGQTPPMMTGNGQPVIAGNVSAINGSILTVTNKSNVTYNVDATNAKVNLRGTAGTVASIKVGDMIVAQGTVNGTSVTATMVIDNGQQSAVTPPQAQGAGAKTPEMKTSRGFLGGVTSFFSRMFGF